MSILDLSNVGFSEIQFFWMENIFMRSKWIYWQKILILEQGR